MALVFASAGGWAPLTPQAKLRCADLQQQTDQSDTAPTPAPCMALVFASAGGWAPLTPQAKLR